MPYKKAAFPVAENGRVPIMLQTRLPHEDHKEHMNWKPYSQIIREDENRLAIRNNSVEMQVLGRNQKRGVS